MEPLAQSGAVGQGKLANMARRPCVTVPRALHAHMRAHVEAFKWHYRALPPLHAAHLESSSCPRMLALGREDRRAIWCMKLLVDVLSTGRSPSPGAGVHMRVSSSCGGKKGAPALLRESGTVGDPSGLTGVTRRVVGGECRQHAGLPGRHVQRNSLAGRPGSAARAPCWQRAQCCQP